MKEITQRGIEDMIIEGKALKCETREEVRKKVESLKEYSTFTLLDDWYYVEGIRWANAVGFILIEGSFELVD